MYDQDDDYDYEMITRTVQSFSDELDYRIKIEGSLERVQYDDAGEVVERIQVGRIKAIQYWLESVIVTRNCHDTFLNAHRHQTRGRPAQPAPFIVAMRDLQLVQGRTRPKVVTWMNIDSQVPGGRMRLGFGAGTSLHLLSGHLDAGVLVRDFRSVPSMAQLHLRSGWDRQATACSH